MAADANIADALFEQARIRPDATALIVPRVVRRGMIAPYAGSPARRLAVLRFVRDIPLGPDASAWPVMADIEQGLERLAGKDALIVWGGRDFIFDSSALELWKRTWPDARVEVLEDGGHFVLEDASNRVVRFARKYLLG